MGFISYTLAKTATTPRLQTQTLYMIDAAKNPASDC